MIPNSLLLFFFTFLSGILVFIIPGIQKKSFKYMLSFSGAYLFSITVIHILPELFNETSDPTLTGIFVLAGFYLQIVIDYFSSGVEHGHIHAHNDHEHHGSGPFLLLISLWIHSLLEGTLLVHPHAHHDGAGTQNLLFGLILHKIPEAIALMSVLLLQIKNRGMVIFLFLIFSVSSPIGLIASEMLSVNHFGSANLFTYLFALVAGNFLHISTTIFFEAQPKEHGFKGNKLLVICLGAFVALSVEYFMK